MTAALIASCADHYGLLVDQVLGRSRHKDCVRARQAIMFVLARRDRMSTPAIGMLLDRDHSTVIHGIRIAEARRATEPQLDTLLSMLMALPRYHREFARVEAAEEEQLSFSTPRPALVPVPEQIILRYTRRRNPHPAICTVQRKAKNDLSPDDKNALARMRGTDKLLIALRREGFA